MGSNKDVIDTCKIVVMYLSVLLETFIFQTTTLRSTVILFYISNEGTSILENFALLGVPIPKKSKNAII